MDQIETLGILDQIQSIVSDKLQVVSYKWLSRNFLVSSNAAKRLLDEFVEKYGNGLEVIYSLSGWLKNEPSTYHIRLVSKQKLSDAKQDFVENCSIQIYSVQGCLPKDPATLWNHEFVQAEDLFKQPLAVDNCLRDNRFCGVSNSCVQRSAGILQGKTTELSKSFSSNQTAAGPQPLMKKVLQTNSITGLRSSDHGKTVKCETSIKQDQEQVAQIAAHKGKAPLPTKDNNCQSDRTSSGTGSALVSMWGRASAKSKSDIPLRQANNSRQNSTATAEAQISAHESVEYESSDEDPLDLNMKRTLNGDGSRKRRVVFDYSDEDDDYKDAVTLASPGPKKCSLYPKQNSNASSSECNLNFQENENKQVIKEVREAGGTFNQHLSENLSAMGKETSKKTLRCVSEADAGAEDKIPNAGSKRSKVLKTRIDERGREVTEVVWEGDEIDTKSASKSVENDSVKNVISRPPVARKSPAVGNSAPANQTGKAGNKKLAVKDPKQGNILSFFRKTDGLFKLEKESVRVKLRNGILDKLHKLKRVGSRLSSGHSRDNSFQDFQLSL